MTPGTAGELAWLRARGRHRSIAEPSRGRSRPSLVEAGAVAALGTLR